MMCPGMRVFRITTMVAHYIVIAPSAEEALNYLVGSEHVRWVEPATSMPQFKTVTKVELLDEEPVLNVEMTDEWRKKLWLP